MVSFPNCKINLGLNIINKRKDGYHDIETVFFPLPFTDALEVIPINNHDTVVTFSSSGLHISGNTKDNLCVKAYDQLKKDYPQLPPVKMHLHKAIPMGAGLGGGSADAAFTLLLLNQKFALGISETDLHKYAAAIGSDCAFFILNKPCFASGRGEILEPVHLSLSGYKILLINPGIHIGTAWAYQHVKPSPREISVKEIISSPIENWKDTLINDFETPVFHQYPELRKLKLLLYESGAVYASMSGSGSTFYGFYRNDTSIEPSSFDKRYFVKMLSVHQ